MEYIRGESREQIILLPDCVDDYITENNSVRVIEAYVNSLDLAGLGCSRQQPNATGRPMYDPKDLLKLYVYGYMNRIRSSRRLEKHGAPGGPRVFPANRNPRNSPSASPETQPGP